MANNIKTHKKRGREGRRDRRRAIKSNLNQFKSIGFMTINMFAMSFVSAANMYYHSG